MEMGAGKVVVIVLVMVVVWEAATTNGLSICNLQEQDLKACEPAVKATNPSKPSQECCDAIKRMSPKDIRCLCDYKNKKPSVLELVGVDPTRAMELPSLCEAPVQVNC
uniref:Bifunctional inhibitor/plant lipid transfer protein/seed storage helical domain-containing protein n=1 Tax=Opuntia streptacantha TaxID=393608 RepID=A0A7C8ZX92_OPUST